MKPRPMRHLKISIVELWAENVEETGCLEPALEKNTNDDDDGDIKMIFKDMI